MIANFAPRSSVIELTTNAVAGMSGPVRSALSAIFALGFQPMGQKGLRLPGSVWKEDLFLSSICATSSAPDFVSATVAAAFSVGCDFVFADAGAGASAASNGATASNKGMIEERNFFIFSECNLRP